MPTVVGIDSSLTSLGLAGIIDGTFGPVARVVSKGHDDDSLGDRWRRQRVIVQRVVEFVQSYDPDLVVIEGPSYASKGGHSHDRSGLWWGIINGLIVEFDITEVPPSNRMKYATGKGNIGKDQVLAAAIKRYPLAEITGNDIADAIILAAMGARYLGTPVELLQATGSLPKANLTAMDTVKW